MNPTGSKLFGKASNARAQGAEAGQENNDEFAFKLTDKAKKTQASSESSAKPAMSQWEEDEIVVNNVPLSKLNEESEKKNARLEQFKRKPGQTAPTAAQKTEETAGIKATFTSKARIQSDEAKFEEEKALALKKLEELGLNDTPAEPEAKPKTTGFINSKKVINNGLKRTPGAGPQAPPKPVATEKPVDKKTLRWDDVED